MILAVIAGATAMCCSIYFSHMLIVLFLENTRNFLVQPLVSKVVCHLSCWML